MRVLLRLWPYLKPHRLGLLSSMALGVILGLLRIGPAPIIQRLVDGLKSGSGNEREILFAMSAILGLYVLNLPIRFGHYYLNRRASIRINEKLQIDLFSHLLSLSADHFTTKATGALAARVANDSTYISSGIQSSTAIFREPATLVACLGYAFWINWRLAVIMLVVVPPLAYLFSRTGKNLKRYIGKMQEQSSQLVGLLSESFTGIRVIKLFRLEALLTRKVKATTSEFSRQYMKTTVLEELSHPLVELITAFALAALVYVGGRAVARGSMSGGQLLSFFGAFALALNPVRSLNDLSLKLHQAAGAAERIFEILDWRTRLVERPDARPIAEFRREIAVKGVSFAYPDHPERPVLRDVSLEIRRGEVVALVGASGSGKSSLAGLIPRIFDVTAGAIEIDGVDVRDLVLRDLQRLVAVVSQEVFLFDDTLYENIRCGRPEATADEVREAARRAHALEFIDARPEGLRTRIGERGQRLSGGERQRISIARAFLRQAPILILDEATSALDAQAERVVQEALQELMKDRTTLVIAHRLSTIEGADRIHVLRDGRIVERGTHADLLARGGDYARFYGTARSVQPR